MGVRAALGLLLMFTATVRATGGVTFWKENVTMTCPSEGSWHDKDNKPIQEKTFKYEFKYENDKKGSYRCEFDGMRYYFYVQGKVCLDCFELDGTLLLGAITMDIVGTAFLMIIIFRCKKKNSAGLSQATKGPARSGGRGPPVPSPDYDELNHRTVGQDPYSMLNSM